MLQWKMQGGQRKRDNQTALLIPVADGDCGRGVGGGGVRWIALSEELRSHQGIAESHYFWSVS